MSFVISELPRELTFNAEGRRRPTLGPNLGPGCYESLLPSKKSAAKPSKATGVLPAAFGSSERRRLNNPISEMLQDLTQFRVIPGVSKNTFAAGSGGVSEPFIRDLETAKNEVTSNPIVTITLLEEIAAGAAEPQEAGEKAWHPQRHPLLRFEV